MAGSSQTDSAPANARAGHPVVRRAGSASDAQGQPPVVVLRLILVRRRQIGRFPNRPCEIAKPRVLPPSFRRRPESRERVSPRRTQSIPPSGQSFRPVGIDRAFARICACRAFPRTRENPPREGGGERMDFGKWMMTKARAWVRAFFAPRRSRVVNPDEEEELRNPGGVVRRRAVRESWGGPDEGSPLRVSGATRALRPRHNENNPVFDKIRQIHAFIPQIRAFFRQIQDPSERGKNIKSLKIKGLCDKDAPGLVISQGRGICPHSLAVFPVEHLGGAPGRRGLSGP